MFSLGATRSSFKSDHLLHTPDTFIRTALPGADGVEFVVHAGARIGAGFSWMTAEFTSGGTLAPLASGLERFIYVLQGAIDLELPATARSASLHADHFAHLPANTPHRIRATQAARAVVIEKTYLPPPGTEPTAQPEVVLGNEANIPSAALGGDEDLQVRRLMPDGPAWDFAVNTMTYAPGAALSQVEIHVMEHGLLMLEGGGIYRLGDSWYPVAAGDFIWMAPWCPQWFGALGKTPAKYLIYKDWYRHPITAGA